MFDLNKTKWKRQVSVCIVGKMQMWRVFSVFWFRSQKLQGSNNKHNSVKCLWMFKTYCKPHSFSYSWCKNRLNKFCILNTRKIIYLYNIKTQLPLYRLFPLFFYIYILWCFRSHTLSPDLSWFWVLRLNPLVSHWSIKKPSTNTFFSLFMTMFVNNLCMETVLFVNHWGFIIFPAPF